MMEAYSVHKPGRRNLAAMLSAGVLIGTLGIAWFQARSHLALGPRVQIAGTNLSVRPPKGWIQDTDQPGLFVLPSENTSRRGPRAPFGRRFRVSAGRDFIYESPYPTHGVERSPVEERQLDPGSVQRVAPIAEMHAVEQVWQATRLVSTRRGPLRYAQTIIIRKAVSPRGDRIQIEYEPHSVPSSGDRLLLDSICAEIQYDLPALSADRAETMNALGVEFDWDPAWRIAAPGREAFAALYVGPAPESEPFWSVAVFRTRLDTAELQRTLARFVGRRGIKLAPRDFLQFTQPLQSDGIDVVGVRYRGDKKKRVMPVGSVWIVSASESETALVVSLARDVDADLASEHARRVAESIRFLPGQQVDPIPIKVLVANLMSRP